jgi:hypothetical protein
MSELNINNRGSGGGGGNGFDDENSRTIHTR